MNGKKQLKEIRKLKGFLTELELMGEYETADVIRQDLEAYEKELQADNSKKLRLRKLKKDCILY